MGARRAGYFTGIIIMIIGLIMVPFGMILMAGGIVESIYAGSGDTFVAGLAFVIFGVILFITGLVAALILKKSGGENVNITINTRDNVIGVTESNPMLKPDIQKALEKDYIEKLPNSEPIQKLPQEIGLDYKSQQEEEEVEEKISQPDMVLDLQEEVEEVSLQDMVLDLQEAEMGERARLDYIAKRLAENRTIYNSDIEYVKKQFTKLRIKITKEDYSDPN